MGGSFLGFRSLGPDEEIESESPRDYGRRNTPSERLYDGTQASHEVLPYRRKTGRRIWIDGEGIVPEYTDDADVAQPTGARESIQAQLAARTKGKP